MKRKDDPNTIVAESWAHLEDLVFEGSWNDRLSRFRSPCAFRGLGDANHDLRTSLMRLGGDYPRLERNLIRSFRKYAHRDVVERDSFWHWLSTGQHHGLPTRLMDWTYSPFVAMHFATSNPNDMERDGAVWKVDYVHAHQFLPKLFRARLEQEGSVVFTVEMLDVLAAGTDQVHPLEQLDTISDDPFLLFFEPPSIDDRIVNQYALFSVISSPSVSLDEWLPRHRDLYQKVVIPAALKREVRDKLDQLNITERVLFPGLDGLTAWLKRYYGPGLDECDDDVRTPSAVMRSRDGQR